MSGIVIRDLAMAEAVPVGTVVADEDGFEYPFRLNSREELVGCTIVEWGWMPVAEAQAMRAEMLAEAGREHHRSRVSKSPSLAAYIAEKADRIEERVERLFPAAIFDAPPAPGDVVTFSPIGDGEYQCGRCGHLTDAPIAHQCPPPPAPEPPAEVDPWEHLRHTISCRTAWCKTCHAAVAALDAHDAEAGS